MSVPTNTTEQGYIALITAILISVSLLVIVVAVSFQGFTSRFTVLESELKEESVYLAEACVQTARLKIAQDITYPVAAMFPENIPVGDRACWINDIDHSGSPNSIVIEAKGTSSDAVTNLEVEVDASSLPIVSIEDWKEVP